MPIKKSTQARRHVRIYDDEIKTAAFRNLSAEAKALLIEVRHRGWPQTNGLETITIRELMAYLRLGAPKADAAFQELVEHGFLAITKAKSRGHTARYRRTDETCSVSGLAPTKEFFHWSAPPTAARRRKG